MTTSNSRCPTSRRLVTLIDQGHTSIHRARDSIAGIVGRVDDSDYDNGNPHNVGRHLPAEMHGYGQFFLLDGWLFRSGRFRRGAQVGARKTFARDGRLVRWKNLGSTEGRQFRRVMNEGVGS